MECLIGIKFNDFVLIAADAIDAYSIIIHSHNEEKFCKLSDKLLMAVVGESGDTTQFAEYISKNIQLYRMRNEYELSPKAAAHFTRRNLAQYLRSRTPYHTNILLAGYDDVEKKADLFYIDYLAACLEVPYCAHGYGGHFTLSTMDAYYRPEMTPAEGVELMKKCIAEIGKRLIINLPRFKLRIVDKDGSRSLADIETQDLNILKN